MAMRVLQLKPDLNLLKDQQIQFAQSVTNLITSDSISFWENNLRQPGLYKNNKTILEKFCLISPGVIYEISKIQNTPFVTYNGKMQIQEWIRVYRSNERINYYFNQQASLNPSFTKIQPKQLYRIASGVKKFIQNQGIGPFLTFQKQLIQKSNFFITPTVLYSQLLGFLAENFQSFTPVQTLINRQVSELRFDVKYQNKLFNLRDFAGIKISCFQLHQSDGTRSEQIIKQIQKQSYGYQKIYKSLEKIEQQIVQNYEQLKVLLKRNEIKLKQQLDNVETQTLVTSIRDEQVQNIPQSTLRQKQQVDNKVSQISQKSGQILRKLIQIQLPKALKQVQSSLVQKQIETSIQLFQGQLKSFSQTSEMSLSQINKLPRDVMIQIIFIQNRKKIKITDLKNKILKIIAQLKKMTTTELKLDQIQIYVGGKHKQITNEVFQYITQPGYQVKVLKQKGIRLLQQQQNIMKLSNQNNANFKLIQESMRKQFQKLFGDFSQINQNFNFSFSQISTNMQNLRNTMEQQKMMLIGLTPNIENQLKLQFQNLQSRYSNYLTKQISDLKNVINNIQVKMEQKFSAVTQNLQLLKGQIKQVLGSLTQISQQISKLNSTTEVIKKLAQQNIIRQQTLTNYIKQFLQKLMEKGYEQMLDSETKLIREQKKVLQNQLKEYDLKKLKIGQQLTQFQYMNQIGGQKLRKKEKELLDKIEKTFTESQIQSKIKEKLNSLNDEAQNTMKDKIAKFKPTVDLSSIQTVISNKIKGFTPTMNFSDVQEKVSGEIEKFSPKIDLDGIQTKIATGIDSFTPELTGIQTKISTGINSFTPNLNGIQDKITAGINSFNPDLTGIQTKIGTGISSFTPNLNGIQDKITAGISSFSPDLTGIQTKIGTGISSFTPNLNGIQDKITAGISSFSPDLTGIQTKIGTGINSFTPNLNGIQDKITAGINSFTPDLTGIQTKIGTGISSFTPNLGGIHDKITAEINSFTPDLTGIQTKIGTGISSFTPNLNGIQDKITAGINSFTPDLTGIQTKIGTGINSFTPNLNGIQDKIATGISSFTPNLDGIQTKIATGINSFTPNLDGIQDRIKNEISSFNPDLNGIQDKITAGIGSFTPNLKGIQARISAGIGSFNPDLTSIETKLQQKLDKLNPSVNMKSIQQKIKKYVNDFQPNVDLSSVNDKINDKLKEHEQQIAKIQANTDDLKKVGDTVQKIVKLYNKDNAKYLIENIPSILTILFNNVVDLFPVGVSSIKTGKKTLVEEIRQIGKKIDLFVMSDNGNAFPEVTLKYRQCQTKYKLLQKAFMKLADGLLVLFNKQSDWMNQFLQDLVWKKKIDLTSAQHALNQIKDNYQNKLSNALAIIIDGFPTPGNSVFDDDPFMKNIYTKFQNPKRTITFDWIKTADKRIRF